MSTREKLTHSFEITRRLVHKFANGLSNEDSLAAPLFKANNFNWVTGHMLVSRDLVLDLLGRPKVLSSAEEALYGTGSELVSAETALSLERLLAAFDTSQAEISQGLQNTSDNELAAVFDIERKQTVLERIEGLHWHETYHLGQLEILRQVSAERESFP